MFPGIKLSGALLRGVIKLRLSTPESITAHLRELRSRSRLDRYTSHRFLKRELQVVFLVTLCDESFAAQKLEVIKHLRTLTIALYRGKEFRKFRFRGMLEGWELPCNSDAQVVDFDEFDYGSMGRVDFSKKPYKCGTCDSYWQKSWKDIRSIETTCRCCELFGIHKDKFFDLESGMPSAQPMSLRAKFSRLSNTLKENFLSCIRIGAHQESARANVDDPSSLMELRDSPVTPSQDPHTLIEKPQ